MKATSSAAGVVRNFWCCSRAVPSKVRAKSLKNCASPSEGHDFGLGETASRLTISLGLAQFIPGESLNTFFSRADQSLYQAKNLGRNQIGGGATQSAG